MDGALTCHLVYVCVSKEYGESPYQKVGKPPTYRHPFSLEQRGVSYR